MKHRCPRQQQSQNMAKISKSYILTPPHSHGHVMLVKCEQPIDELTVQIWLLYHHPNFRYCTLFVSGTELRTDRQTVGQTDRRTIRLLDAPRRTFQTGGIKIYTKIQYNLRILESETTGYLSPLITKIYDSEYAFSLSIHAAVLEKILKDGTCLGPI